MSEESHTYRFLNGQFMIICSKTGLIFRPSKEGWSCGCNSEENNIR